MLTNANTLIILPPAGCYPQKLYDSIKCLGYDVCRSMKGGNNIFCRAYRSISMRYNLSIRSALYGNWYKKKINKYENILIFHDKYSFPIIKVIQERLKFSGMIYMYYMDPIGTEGAKDCNKVRVEMSDHFRIYSFEEKDCKKYGFKYNSLFFFHQDVKKVDEYWSDVFFIGTDKGRLKEILEIENMIQRAGMNIDVHVCRFGNKASEYGLKIHYQYRPMIPYDELMEKLYHTRCVLDVTPEGQEEITLRVYEALFCNKKVITNNRNIKRYNFYDSNNIFIIGEDSINKIKEFVYGEFHEAKEQKSIVDMDFEHWIRRFA